MKLTNEQLLEKGSANLKEGKTEEAESNYQAILKTDPKHPHANHNLGVLLCTYNKLGKLKASIPLLKIATEVNPENAQFWMSYGNALYNTKKINDAEVSFRKVIELKPDYSYAYNNLGSIQYTTGRLDEALINFKKAIEYKPDLPESLNSMGAIFKDQHRFLESESMFKQAITIKADYAEAHNNLGNLYKDLGRFKDAVGCFNNVLDIDPKYPQLYYSLMNALENEAKYYHKKLFEDISISDKLKAIESSVDKVVKKEVTIDIDTINTLNKLSVAINKLYGFLPGVKNAPPSINQGPSGQFANEFYKQWNSRFITKVKIAFVMNKYPVGCRHVLIKLPNDKLFDGGVGVHDFTIYNQENLELAFMEKYDLETLDKHSWGITRTNYAQCPNYSLSEIISIIVKYLDEIYTK